MKNASDIIKRAAITDVMRGRASYQVQDSVKAGVARPVDGMVYGRVLVRVFRRLAEKHPKLLW